MFNLVGIISPGAESEQRPVRTINNLPGPRRAREAVVAVSPVFPTKAGGLAGWLAYR